MEDLSPLNLHYAVCLQRTPAPATEQKKKESYNWEIRNYTMDHRSGCCTGYNLIHPETIGIGISIPYMNDNHNMQKKVILHQCKMVYDSVMKFLSLFGYMKTAISTLTSNYYMEDHYVCNIRFDCWEDIKNYKLAPID